jgi:hypothetical protein
VAGEREKTVHETTATPAEDGPDPGWTWPPPGPAELAGSPAFTTETWAPPSTVRHPLVRVGRVTLLYRRARPRRAPVAVRAVRLARLLAARLTGWSGGQGRWRRRRRR